MFLPIKASLDEAQRLSSLVTTAPAFEGGEELGLGDQNKQTPKKQSPGLPGGPGAPRHLTSLKSDALLIDSWWCGTRFHFVI